MWYAAKQTIAGRFLDKQGARDWMLCWLLRLLGGAMAAKQASKKRRSRSRETRGGSSLSVLVGVVVVGSARIGLWASIARNARTNDKRRQQTFDGTYYSFKQSTGSELDR